MGTEEKTLKLLFEKKKVYTILAVAGIILSIISAIAAYILLTELKYTTLGVIFIIFGIWQVYIGLYNLNLPRMVYIEFNEGKLYIDRGSLLKPRIIELKNLRKFFIVEDKMNLHYQDGDSLRSFEIDLDLLSMKDINILLSKIERYCKKAV